MSDPALGAAFGVAAEGPLGGAAVVWAGGDAGPVVVVAAALAGPAAGPLAGAVADGGDAAGLGAVWVAAAGLGPDDGGCWAGGGPAAVPDAVPGEDVGDGPAVPPVGGPGGDGGSGCGLLAAIIDGSYRPGSVDDEAGAEELAGGFAALAGGDAGAGAVADEAFAVDDAGGVGEGEVDVFDAAGPADGLACEDEIICRPDRLLPTLEIDMRKQAPRLVYAIVIATAAPTSLEAIVAIFIEVAENLSGCSDGVGKAAHIPVGTALRVRVSRVDAHAKHVPLAVRQTTSV